MTDRLPDEPSGQAASPIGRQFGVYRVLSLLGTGGMGEVYRAHDSRLDRDVAIKVLPHAVAADPERLRRFEREARVLATLNHPHIGGIYGVEDAGGVPALVLELVEGETLADRLRQGPMTPGEVLSIARQLADALDAAHDKGIIHRDLKPANLKITPDGALKVLDFGLARADAADERRVDPTESPTLTSPATRAGVILGTATYMSPEQARGRPLDKRTDVWSFGCVLYEILTGRPPFSGETVSDTIAAILERQPDWSALPANTPPGLRRLLGRCLEKDRKQRLRDIGDARVDLENQPHEQSQSSDRRRRLAIGALSVLLLVAVVSLVALLTRRDQPAAAVEPVRRFSMDLGYVRPVISPDGRRIAYRLDGRLWVRDIDSETPREIPAGAAAGAFNSDVAYYLTWSPDSRDIVFPAEGELRRVPVQDGGSATIVCKLPPGRMANRHVAGIAWSRDGETIVFSRYEAGIYEVPARGGAPVLLTKEDHADDVLLFETGEGRAIVFADSKDVHELVVWTPKAGRRVIARLETSWPELVYSPSGHILFRRDPTESPSIWALPFSSATLTTTGEPVLVERAGQGVSLADDGTLLYLDNGRIRGHRLAWRDRGGKILAQSGQTHEDIASVSLARDGKRAVVTARDGSMGAWLYDAERLVRTRFDVGGPAGGRVVYAFFSQPASDVLYSMQESPDKTEVFAKAASGFGEARLMPAPAGFKVGFKVAQSRTADGRYLLLVGRGGATGVFNMWLWRNDGPSTTGEAVHYSQNSESETAATLSPNERFVAYTSTASGRLEVYVRPFPTGEGRWQVSVNGGQAPAWRPDGSELFFSESGTLMVSRVSTVGEFSASAPERLFEHPTLRAGPAPVARYAVSVDGQRFLTVESERDREKPVNRVVQNWLSEFSRTAPKAGE
jgi:Tol biopolymer transport system component